MAEIKSGTEVYVKATIVRRARDERPEEKRGYLVQTSRGKVFVEASEIICPKEGGIESGSTD